ncbi:MAG: 23S rRNA pseudouridine(2604) synthase RluF [Balneolaceae bacterium]|nr:MAG: 23S rRNA pseudouridine(2604) synthase RluF [Balneolaceae bacterium]
MSQLANLQTQYQTVFFYIPPTLIQHIIVPVRLNKFISDAGICSRREADRMIKSGHVRVNGKPAQLGDLVSDADRVLVNGNPVEMRSEHVYLAYNKPVGITSTTDRSDSNNILKALAYYGGRVFPVGRLDKDSEGLILFTDDGDIVNKILRASNKHDKEYIVSVNKPVTPGFVRQMAEGVSILGVMTRRCTVEKINTHTIRIILNQGLNRQIRRMCEALGYEVTRLQRIRVMNISLSGIDTGTWRFLTDSEKDSLLQAVAGSRKEAAARRPRKRNSSGAPKVTGKPGAGSESHRKKKAGNSDGADSPKSGSGKSASDKPRTRKNLSDTKIAESKRDKRKGAKKTSGGKNSGAKRFAPTAGRSTTRNLSKGAAKSTGKSRRTGSKSK